MTDGPDAHEILPGLWLGNRIAALNDRWLKQQEITVVFNCTKDLPFSPIIKKQYRLPVDDNLKAEEIRNMTLWSHEAVYKVLAEYNKNQKVLVHCAAGMQRSATVVGMLLIAMKGMTWQQAINYIQGIRLIAFRDQPNFKDSLIAFDTSYHREILPHISEPL
jgi:protein tyrosine/serine phosphatase|uniref:Dual specificity phosphatase catalytic domain n=1 Tax=viral metagenome TaxID=1070528 RepID=A0A6C0K8I9_9ZZZZ